jgi:hypothetical protein
MEQSNKTRYAIDHLLQEERYRKSTLSMLEEFIVNRKGVRRRADKLAHPEMKVRGRRGMEGMPKPRRAREGR